MKRVNSISQVNDFLVWTKNGLSPSVQEATRKVFSEEFKDRFSFGNTLKYGYTPNTEKYEQRKIQKYGAQPQLVATGNLRNSVQRFIVNKKGMRVVYPVYGKYQMGLGRDFLKFRKADIEAIKKISFIILRNHINTY